MVKPDGTIWAAGDNTLGQLAMDTEAVTMMTNFVEVLSGGAKAVATGGGHSMVVKKDGSLWSTGGNMFGQLGDGSNTHRHSFVPLILGDAQAATVAAGAEHSLAIMQDGSVWATGLNMHGQLGDGTTTNRDTFSQVIPGGADAVAAGRQHSMVMKEDGSVWAAGNNKSGQLGDDFIGSSSKFVKVISSGVTAVAAGAQHSMVLKQDGSVWVTGDNEYGQLGDGSEECKFVFEQVISGGVKAIGAGFDHSMVLKQDGSVWTTGNNNFGQLGDASDSFRSGFVQVISSGVDIVAAGYWHNMVVKDDGSLWATGSNEFGQLADGSTIGKRNFARVDLQRDGMLCSVLVHQNVRHTHIFCSRCADILARHAGHSLSRCFISVWYSSSRGIGVNFTHLRTFPRLPYLLFVLGSYLSIDLVMCTVMCCCVYFRLQTLIFLAGQQLQVGIAWHLWCIELDGCVPV